MADGLASNHGIGTGEAQVFNTSGNINLYGRLLQQAQAKREAEQKQLADELGKVKLDGLREPDQPEYFNKYNEVRSLASQITGEKNGLKKAQLKAQVDKGLLELNEFARNSKNFGKQYVDMQGKLLDNRFRDQFADDAIDKVSQANKLPMNDPGFVKDFTGLARRVDAEKIDKLVGGIDKNLLGKTQWGNPVQVRNKQGNKTGVQYYNQREVNPVEQMAAYANEYDHNRDFRKLLQDQYPDVYQSNDEKTAKALVLKDYADKRRSTGTLSESTQPQFKPDWQPDKFYEHQAYLQAQKQSNAALEDDGRDEFVNALQQKDTNARGDLIRAVNRAGGRFSPNKHGFTVVIPTPQKVTQTDSNGKITSTTEMQDKVYTITNDASEKSKELINTMLNQVDLFKPRPLYEKKSNPYGSKPNTKPASSSSTTTKVSSSKSGGGDMATVQLPDGRQGQIPKDKVADFLKQYPKAKKL